MRCELPSYTWSTWEGSFSEEDLRFFERYLRNNAHLICAGFPTYACLGCQIRAICVSLEPESRHLRVRATQMTDSGTCGNVTRRAAQLLSCSAASSRAAEGAACPRPSTLSAAPWVVGKTAVCRELNRLLPASVMLDGDWCWQADPFQVTPETKRMALDNICHLLGNFLRCSAYENVVFGWVMHERAIVEEIVGRCPSPRATCGYVRSRSWPAAEELRRRVEKDVRSGLRDEGAVTRSLAYLPRYRELGGKLVDTTGLTPHEVAELLAR